MTQHLSYLSWILLLLPACTHRPIPGAAQGNAGQALPVQNVVSTVPADSTTLAPRRASWTVLSQKASVLPGLATLFQLRVQGGEGTAEISVVRFDSRHCTLRVIDQPEAWSLADKLGGSMRQSRAIAGVNGGYFHPDFTPVGLTIASGKSQGQLTSSSLVSGMLRVRHGGPELVWNSESADSADASDLLQAGPRLVHHGLPVSGLNDTRRAARTFIATDGEQGWLIGVVRNTTLRGLADLLGTPGLISGLQIQRALNFDGGRSTAFYARMGDGREISEPGWSTVRNYVAVVPR